MISLLPSDFACVGLLAKACDNDKLCIAVNEAFLFDLTPLLCDMAADVEANWDEVDEPWNTLINGGEYEACNGKTKTLKGLKDVLVYYSYARYLMLSNYNDSAGGMVTKTNQFSLPVPLKEVEMFSNKYRNMGKILFEKVESYLCLNQDEFDDFDNCNCKSCGCNGCCNSKTQAKGFGIRGSNISKASSVEYTRRKPIVLTPDVPTTGGFPYTFPFTLS